MCARAGVSCGDLVLRAGMLACPADNEASLRLAGLAAAGHAKCCRLCSHDVRSAVDIDVGEGAVQMLATTVPRTGTFELRDLHDFRDKMTMIKNRLTGAGCQQSAKEHHGIVAYSQLCEFPGTRCCMRPIDVFTSSFTRMHVHTGVVASCDVTPVDFMHDVLEGTALQTLTFCLRKLTAAGSGKLLSVADINARIAALKMQMSAEWHVESGLPQINDKRLQQKDKYLSLTGTL